MGNLLLLTVAIVGSIIFSTKDKDDPEKRNK